MTKKQQDNMNKVVPWIALILTIMGTGIAIYTRLVIVENNLEHQQRQLAELKAILLEVKKDIDVDRDRLAEHQGQINYINSYLGLN